MHLRPSCSRFLRCILGAGLLLALRAPLALLALVAAAGAHASPAATALFAVPASAAAFPLFGDGFEQPGAPKPGAVIFTEILSNPVLVSDQFGEWFEIANVGGRLVQLQGCVLHGNSGSSTIAESMTLGQGELAVFARSTDPNQNGNVPADAAFDFPLLSSDLLTLDCGSSLIDATGWSSETAGRSRSLDADAWDASANDIDANWCLSVASYNGTDTGTPGSPLHDCSGDSELRPPEFGELWINELMSRTALPLADANAEWIELKSFADVRVSLDLCTVGNGGAGISSLAGLRVDPGGFLLLARSPDPSVNGGLVVDGTFSFTLVNFGGMLVIVCDGWIIDEVPYPAATSGRSLLRESANLFCSAPVGTPEYSTNNFGTPRQENDPDC